MSLSAEESFFCWEFDPLRPLESGVAGTKVMEDREEVDRGRLRVVVEGVVIDTVNVTSTKEMLLRTSVNL